MNISQHPISYHVLEVFLSLFVVILAFIINVFLGVITQ